MSGRRISNQERAWLDEELRQWSSAGLIDAAAAEGIRGSYETVATSGQRKHALARLALQGIASLLVGLAVLLLIGYNWDRLYWGIKLALIFSSVAGTHALALYLRTSTSAQRAAEAVFFLGCMFYGAGIWLVAQVFHLDAHYPDGLWWWALGVLPFALCLDTLLLHALLVGLLALWTGTEVLGFAHLSPWWLWNWWPNGAYSLPLLAAPGFVWAYRRSSPYTLAMYVALLAWWVVLQAIAWNLQWQSVYLVGLIGALFLIVAENHRRSSPLAVPYRVFGMLMLGGSLIAPSFADFHREMHSTWSLERLVPAFALLVLFLVVTGAALAFTLLLRPLGEQANHSRFVRLFEIARRQWVPLAFVLAIAALATLGLMPEVGVVIPTVIANLAMLGFALWLMHAGLHDEQGVTFAAGVIYFLMWTIFRYIDLFGDYGGMLGAALMFFLCGAALWGLTIVWGRRKEIRHA
ncbi:MAG: DUF2157 domain-containing protein [Pirellulales bacterium]